MTDYAAFDRSHSWKRSPPHDCHCPPDLIGSDHGSMDVIFQCRCGAAKGGIIGSVGHPCPLPRVPAAGIIVQARMGSQRLGGKVMAPAAGRPLLSHLIERVRRSRTASKLVIGTTTDPSDDVVARLAAAHDVACYRWPSGQSNLLAGFIAAAERFEIDTVVRVTADCPLIDVAYLDAAVDGLGEAEYLMPVGLPDGMGCEVVRLETLQRALPLSSAEEREHVTLFIRRHPEQFDVITQATGHGLDAERWTVDTPEDLALVRHVIEALPPGFTLTDIRDLLAANPQWRALNAAIPAGPIDREITARYSLPMRHVASAPSLGDL